MDLGFGLVEAEYQWHGIKGNGYHWGLADSKKEY